SPSRLFSLGGLELGSATGAEVLTTQAEGQGLSALVPEAPIIIGTLRLAINQIAQTGYRAVDKDPLQSAITRTRAGPRPGKAASQHGQRKSSQRPLPPTTCPGHFCHHTHCLQLPLVVLVCS